MLKYTGKNNIDGGAMEILKDKIPMTIDIINILHTLQSYGKGYIVGGYVRDNLLGLKPNDCDFCTTVGQLYLMDIFKSYRPMSIHSKLKVTQIRYKNIYYQITGMQYNEEISDDEKIYQDLKRRDLTINAIAFDGESFYADPYAFEDLENKVIRFVGDPVKTVIGDPIRILRAVRLYAVKNFKTIEPQSYEAMKKFAPLLLRADSRRIKSEIDKMVFLEDKTKALEILDDLKLSDLKIPLARNISITVKQLLLGKSPTLECERDKTKDNINLVEIALNYYEEYEKLMSYTNSLETDKKITEMLNETSYSSNAKRRVLMLLRGQYDFFRLHFRKSSLAENELNSYMKKAGYPEEIRTKVLKLLNEQDELSDILSEKKIKTLINKTNMEYFPELFELVKEIFKKYDKCVTDKYMEMAIEKIKEISISLLNIKKKPKKKKKKKKKVLGAEENTQNINQETEVQ